MAEAQRVEIGFEGGQVIAARLAEDDLKDLRKQLEKGGWHDLHTEDGVISLYLGKVAFLRIASERPPRRLRLASTEPAPVDRRRFAALRGRLLAAPGGVLPARSASSAPTPSGSASLRSSRRHSDAQIRAPVTGPGAGRGSIAPIGSPIALRVAGVVAARAELAARVWSSSARRPSEGSSQARLGRPGRHV